MRVWSPSHWSWWDFILWSGQSGSCCHCSLYTVQDKAGYRWFSIYPSISVVKFSVLNGKRKYISAYSFPHFCKKKQENIYFSQANALNLAQSLFPLCLLARIPLYFHFHMADNSQTGNLNWTLCFQNKHLKISKKCRLAP